MIKTFIVGYDGTKPSERALDFAAKAAKGRGAAVLVVHVLEWSPYSFLTMEEIAERHKLREKEVVRARSVVDPVCEKLRADGLTVNSEVRYGDPAEIMCEIAGKHPESIIVVGRKGTSNLASRFMGTLGISLIQASPVPVTVVP